MRVRTVVALLVGVAGAVARAQVMAGVAAEIRAAGSLAASRDGSAAGAGVDSTTPAPPTSTPTPPPATPPVTTVTTVTPMPPAPEPTPTTPTPSGSNSTEKNITKTPEPPAPTTPAPPPTTVAPTPLPPAPSNHTDPNPPVDLNTSPPPPAPPGIVDTGSPAPPVVQPGVVEPPGSPGGASSDTAATPVPVESPTAVPYMPAPESPSPPRPIGLEPSGANTPEPAPFTSEIRESRAPSPTGSVTTSSPSTASSSSTEAGATPTPTTLEYSVGTTGATTSPPRIKQYRRGDSVILVKKQLSDGTVVDVEVVVSESNSPALLVRDITTKSSTGNATGSAHSTGWFAFTVSALAAATLFMLLLTHFVAVEPSFAASLPVLMRPNQWELLVFITYIQAMASTAHYAVTAVPTSLWTFLDAFSWTVFIPNHHSDSAISAKADSANSRRLTEVVVLDGLVAFADRVGVDETSLLQTSVTGMVVIFVIVMILALPIVLLVKSRRDKQALAKTANDPFGLGVLPRTLAIVDAVGPVRVTACSPVLLMFGVVVVLAVFALYPVTLLVTFEIASQIRARLVSASSLAIAGVVVVAVPVLLVARSVSVLRAVDSEAQFKDEHKYRAVWGILSSSECVRYESRLVFAAVWLAMQLASALVVGAVLSATWQLVLLLVIDVAFVAVLFLNRPFAEDQHVATIFAVTVTVVKAINTSLAFAFSSEASTTTARHQRVATAFVVLNSLVIAVWCVRQLVTTVRVWALFWGHHSLRKNTVESSDPASSNAASLPPSHLSQSPSGAQYESTLYVALASTQQGHRGTAVL